MKGANDQIRESKEKMTRDQMWVLFEMVLKNPEFGKEFKENLKKKLEDLKINVNDEEIERAMATASHMTQYPPHNREWLPQPLPKFDTLGLVVFKVGVHEN